MAKITVVGGTGFAGSHIAKEAAARGHEVTVISRKAPADPIPGVKYVEGDVLDPGVLKNAVANTDVVVEALSPRGALTGKLVGVAKTLFDDAEAAGVRVGVVGGAGSLLVSEGGPTLVDAGGFPEAIKPEAYEVGEVLDLLRASDDSLNWFFLSPAAEFGAHVPGVATGKFRLGGDVLVSDENGVSRISGADFATAFVDEIETPKHIRERFTVAY